MMTTKTRGLLNMVMLGAALAMSAYVTAAVHAKVASPAATTTTTSSVTTTSVQADSWDDFLRERRTHNILTTFCFSRASLAKRIGVRRARLEFADSLDAKHLCGSIVCSRSRNCKFVSLVMVEYTEPKTEPRKDTKHVPAAKKSR